MFQSCKEILEKVSSHQLTAEDCVTSFFDRISQVEEKIRSFISLDKYLAIKRAKEIDRKAKEGKPLGKLFGVCIAIKDNICTKGIRTSCASKILDGYVPPFNATVIEKLIQEDAIIIGKTNMDEFAMGSTTETSCFGPTRNPWDTSYVAGGSSGGSAAAVASGEALLALGSDTGGSIRCPASYCSVVGLKPTYGLISRYGLIAYANSLEQIGPITKNVEDCALLLSIISGYDDLDSTSAKVPKKDYTMSLKGDLEGIKIGLIKNFFAEGVDEKVTNKIYSGIKILDSIGAKCEELSIEFLEYALPSYYIIAMSEASSNLARYDGLRYGSKIDDWNSDWNNFVSKSRGMKFGKEVKRRIILGTYALSAGYYNEYFLKALKIRTLICQEFEKAFKNYDALIGPTMPNLPFKIGEKINDPLSMYMSDILTVPSNLVGNPSISIPCGFVGNLPIGMQIMSSKFREDLLLRISYAFEKKYNFRFPKSII